MHPAPHLQIPAPTALVQWHGLHPQCSPHEQCLCSTPAVGSSVPDLHLHASPPGHGVGHPHVSLHTIAAPRPRTSAISSTSVLLSSSKSLTFFSSFKYCCRSRAIISLEGFGNLLEYTCSLRGTLGRFACSPPVHNSCPRHSTWPPVKSRIHRSVDFLGSTSR